MKVQDCRSCREPVVWVETERGKRMPIDAEPSPQGTFVLEDEEAETPRALYAPKSFGERYTSHFATCPEVDEWRR